VKNLAAINLMAAFVIFMEVVILILFLN
jgi:hypothetical protein